MAEINLVMSKHALEQARERGVSINEIKETIQKGIKFIQDGKIIASFRHIRIVYRKIKDEHHIITVMVK